MPSNSSTGRASRYSPGVAPTAIASSPCAAARLRPAQRRIDDLEEAGCSLGKIAAQIAKVVRRGDSSENDDGRAMHPGQQPARTAQLCFKIIETFQQRNDELAAGGEIGSTGGAFGSQPLQLSELRQHPGRTSQCVSQPAVRAAVAA